MYINQIIIDRFSVRNYKNIPVEREKLLQVLEAARVAPSAVNFQPWHFIVIENQENLEKIKSVYAREWITSAPVVIIACVDHSKSWKRRLDGKDSADIDISIAVDHMTLQAVELGLGTCWVCNFDAKKCSELFKLPENIEPVVLLPLGYANIEKPEKIRKTMDEIVHWEIF